jgi:hypothetical protein
MSNEPQHTPEPWVCQLMADHNGTFYKITDEQGVTIADVPVNPLDPPGWPEANARLITAAPKLLAALHQLVYGEPGRRDYQYAEAAIAEVGVQQND